ncbi:hypothetical protein DLAC_08840 [Tieghemostelium lacteum]|uniref:Carbohydrate binding domain-containing protein n=1 Tax=Tieghemostelium lacteum TaxID=361077 RepID=A0A151Z8I1_TIELA|nr:hypothetical protein DLAC_08840 [Tieghemostelium lacteum]|eukprot:KYQ90238.1 hypothetical protein DLAC_08840 [Tieghemostelium lacteum]
MFKLLRHCKRLSIVFVLVFICQYNIIVTVADSNTIKPTPRNYGINGCGMMKCSVGQQCLKRDLQYHCILMDKQNQIALVHDLIRVDKDRYNTYSTFSVRLINFGDFKTLYKISIDLDESFELLNSGSIWKIRYNADNDTLSLPNYLDGIGIPPKSDHKFGYTIKGFSTPNVYISFVKLGITPPSDHSSHDSEPQKPLLPEPTQINEDDFDYNQLFF